MYANRLDMNYPTWFQRNKMRIRNLKLTLIHLASGRSDAIVENPTGIKHHVEQLELESYIKQTHLFDQSTPFHLMISKTSKDRNIIREFNLNITAFLGISQVHNYKVQRQPLAISFSQSCCYSSTNIKKDCDEVLVSFSS
jgi:hypothetical protein